MARMVDSKPENSTIELKRSRLKLRDDLTFVPQKHQGESFYHIESQSRYFRVGYAEYVFISLLDGATTFCEALAISAQKLGKSSLSTDQAMQTYLWLIENKLGVLAQTPLQSGFAFNVSETPPTHHRLNPFWIRVPIGSPDRLMSWLAGKFRWLFSPATTGFGFCLIVMAFSSAMIQWDRVSADSVNVFSPSNLAWMGLAWLALKLVHEFAHGIVARYYGCEVSEAGLVFILFAPMAYVDVTSSWRLTSKWKRIHIAAAGMYFELVIASIAYFLWRRVDSELTSFLLYDVMIMASISTIAFNLNPLMRFDGYYILSDLLGIPNLYEKGAKSVHSLSKRILYGRSTCEASEIGRPALLIACYGWLSLGWRMLVCASLAIVAATLFQGAGIIIAVAGITSWIGRPVYIAIQDLRHQFERNKPTFYRAATVCLAFGGLSMTLLFSLPMPARVTASGIVEYRELANVRSIAPGFIEKVLVDDGDYVEAGEALFKLRNDDISNQFHELQIQIEQCRVRHRIAMDQHEVAQAQIANRNRESLEEKLVQARRRHHGLTVRAPRSGIVTRHHLKHMKGTYVHEGEELVSIGEPDDTELIAYISQSDFDTAVPYLDRSVYVRISGSPRMEGTLSRLEPTSCSELLHPALSSTEGGTLTVVPPKATASPDTFELAESHFRGHISITDATSRSLFAGQRGTAIIGWKRHGLAEGVYLGTRNWLQNQLDRVRDSRR